MSLFKRYTAWILATISLIILSDTNHLFGQRKVYGVPFMQNYGLGEHGGGLQTWGILQDSQGVMFFANIEGVLTFDGHHWRTIVLSNGETARDLDQYKEGNIYVGGIGDLGYLAPDSLGALAFFSLLNELPNEHRDIGDIINVVSIDEGTFFVTNPKIYHYKDNTFNVFEIGEGYKYYRGLKVDGEFVVMDNEQGVLKFEDDQLVPISGNEHLSKSGLVAALPYDDKGRVVVKINTGVVLLDSIGNRLELPDRLKNLDKIIKSGFAHSVRQISNNRFSIITPDGGCIITDDQFREIYRVDLSKGLINNYVSSDFLDKDGNLWLATQSGITQLILSSPFTVADDRLGVDQGVLSAVVYNNRLYLGTNWGIKEEQSDGSFRQIEGTDYEIWDLDVVNDRLYASMQYFIELVTNQSIKRLTRQHVIRGLVPLKKHKGYFIVTTSLGGLVLMKDKGHELEEVHIIKGFDDAALNLIEDNRGFLWVSNGFDPLKRLTINAALDSIVEIKSFGKAEGLEDGSGTEVAAYEFEKRLGILIIDGENYYTYDPENDKFSIFAPLEGMHSGSKGYQFAYARDGTIYTESGDKKVRYTPDGLSFTIDTISFPKIADFATERIIISQDQSVLYMTADGLVQFHPELQTKSSTNFETMISKVESGNITLFGGDTASMAFEEMERTLLYKDNSMIFRFSALFFEESERNTFSYKLEGFDEEWSDWTKVNFKEYTNLKEGTYVFRVKSKNLYGVEGSQATFSLSISAPWYRSTLAFIGYVILAIVVIALIVRSYTYRLIKEKEKLEQIVKERTLEISKQKDELRVTNVRLLELGQFKQNLTSMIAHDLKNPLSVIIKMGEKKASGLAKKMLNLVLNMLDVEKFEETEIRLNLSELPFNQLVNQAINEVRDTIQESNLELKIESRESLLVNMDIELIERVLINLLTNAVKYAPVNSTLFLDLKMKAGHQLYFSIRDEGQGIPKDKQEIVFDRYIQLDKRVETRVKSTGLGLAFCKMVIEAHGGGIGVVSEEGRGAKFWFTLQNVTVGDKVKLVGIEEQNRALTPLEINLLNTILPRLSKLKAYQSTEIEQLTASLNTQEGDSLYNYLQKIINCSYNGDEPGYQELIEHLNTP